MTLISSSHHLPMNKKVLPKADLRRECTAWGLLVWAYRDEAVLYANDGVGPDEQFASNGLVLQRMGETGIGRGCINALHLPHEDAFAVDAFVAAWMDGIEGGRGYVAHHAGKGRLPVHPDRLPRLRLVPILRGNGKVLEYMHPVTRRGYLCPLAAEGLDMMTIARTEAMHTMFEALLSVLVGKGFASRKVVNRGA